MDIDKPRRLFQAVSDKDMKIAKIIIDSCNSPADIMNHKNNSQFTTLMQAVQLIPEDIAFQFTKLLVSKNAKIDLQNKFGQTALILAAAKGYSSIVCYLMENNCNYELRDKVSLILVFHIKSACDISFFFFCL